MITKKRLSKRAGSARGSAHLDDELPLATTDERDGVSRSEDLYGPGSTRVKSQTEFPMKPVLRHKHLERARLENRRPKDSCYNQGAGSR